MEGQGIVIVVRLSDIAESDQPDPLCLRLEDLSKWRHLEALLRSMYMNPPQAVMVTYLDNDDDWVQISCDDELAEAVRITQQSDKILLFQVKRLDPLIYFESTLPPKSTTTPERHTSPQPEEEYLRRIASQPLVYPHPTSGPPSFVSCDNGPSSQTHLMFPHPTWSPHNPSPPPSAPRPNENVMLLTASGKSASIQNRPDLSTEEKISQLRSMMSPESIKANWGSQDQGLNSLSSSTAVWDQASSMSSREKLKFLKQLIPAEDANLQTGSGNSSTEPLTSQHVVESCSAQTSTLIEPLCPERGSLGKNALSNQDPFETLSTGKPSHDLEQIHLPEPTLTPTKSTNQGTAAMASVVQSVSLQIDPNNGPASSDQHHRKEGVVTLPVAGLSNPPVMDKARPSKGAPVPLPRTLQMMEGAQSGANAVAIEIPESYHGAAHKEEDVTASGGASCTLASAETGETSSEGIHHAAAVGRQVKRSTDQSAVSAITVQVSPLHSKKQSHSERKKKAESPKSESRSGKRKDSGSKDHSAKKKSSGEKSKKEGAASKKEEKKAKDEGASGEPKGPVLKGDASTQYKDIVKYMRRMKKELHSNIVKDVTKQTDKLMKKNFERSMSCEPAYLRENFEGKTEACHKGVVCDCCNRKIHGIRYKCGNCADFDLCARCESLPYNHEPSHVFVKLRRPARNAGVEVPLLRENLYHCESVSDENGDDYTGGLSHHSSEEHADPYDDYDDGVERVPDTVFLASRDQLDDEEDKYESDQSLTQAEVDKLFEIINRSQGHPFCPTESAVAVREEPSETSDESSQSSSIPPVSSEEPARQAMMKLTESESIASVSKGYSIVEVKGELETDGDEEGCTEEEGTKLEPIASASKGSRIVEVTGESETNGDEEGCAEEEGREEPLLGNEAGVNLDENCNVTEESDPSSADSDSSDDFCIIDPPSREEFEACGMEFSAHADLALSSIQPCPLPETMQSVADSGDIETDSAVNGLHSFVAIPQPERNETVGQACSEEKVNGENLKEIQQKCPSAVEDASISSAVEVVESASFELATQNDVCEDETTVLRGNDGTGKEGNDSTEKHLLVGETDCDAKEEERREEDQQGGDDDLLMKMTAEERRRFMVMFEDLKKKTMDLEVELNKSKAAAAENESRQASMTTQSVEYQKEKEVQLILRAKRREAEIENERLEKINKVAKETDERLEKMNMKEVAAKLEKWQAMQVEEKKKREELVRPKQGEEKRSQELASRKATAGEDQIDGAKEQGKTELSAESENLPTASVVTGSYDNVVFRQAKKDTDCQTNANLDPAAQASQVIQQITHGMSRAASSAFYTAKDVIYSLQAKQAEKKMPVNNNSQKPAAAQRSVSYSEDTWTPPASVWTPPKDDYIPPKSQWTPSKSNWAPPKSNWTPSKSNWTPPKQDWTPPKQDWTPPKSDWKPPASSYKPAMPAHDGGDCQREDNNAVGQPSKQETGATVDSSNNEPSNFDGLSSEVSPVVTSPPIADPALHQEMVSMERLQEMGFINRGQNRRLLQRFSGDLEKVVQSLLQEEGEH